MTGDLGDAKQQSKFLAFRAFLLIHVGAETAMSIHRALRENIYASPLGDMHLYVWIPLLAACALGLKRRWGRRATAVCTGLLFVDAVLLFPDASNHSFVEFLCLGAVTLLDLGNVEQRVILGRGLRGLLVIILFYSGLQKVLYGTYFDGQFLGHLIAAEDRFAYLFQWLLPGEEFARLRGLGGFPTVWGAPLPDGSYRVDAPLLVACSNLTYIAEMGLAILLLIPRTRTPAVWGTVLLIVAIELGAREITFGVLMLNLVLLFHPRDLIRPLLPYVGLGYAYLLASRIGLVAGFEFHA